MCLTGTEIWYGVCENVPTVLCGNKVDTKEGNVKAKINCLLPQEESSVQQHCCQKYHFEKPFLWQAGKLTGDPKWEIAAVPALDPPEVVLDPALAAQDEPNLEVAQTFALLDDDGL